MEILWSSRTPASRSYDALQGHYNGNDHSNLLNSRVHAQLVAQDKITTVSHSILSFTEPAAKVNFLQQSIIPIDSPVI